jgi:hypothetical protein
MDILQGRPSWGTDVACSNWRSPVRELGGDGFQFGMFVVEADAWYRSEGGGE